MHGIGKVALIGGALLLLGACRGGTGPLDLDQSESGNAPIFEIQVSDESFHVAVADAKVAAELERYLEAGETLPALNGTLRPGAANVNDPYDWHLDPETVRVVDVTMEVCDGLPGFVQEDLEYWLGTVQQYCPWGPRVIRRR